MDSNGIIIVLMLLLLILVSLSIFIGFASRRQSKEERLVQENEELKQIFSDQEKMLEEERERIAHDLHDDLTQLLAGTRLALENLRLEPSLSTRNKSLLIRIDHDLHALLGRVQDIIWNLSPQSLGEKGLSYALWKMCDNLKELRAFHVEFLEMGKIQRFSPDIELTLFRIVQEIVNNTIRHSLAWNIYVKVYWTETVLSIEIKDDGVGKGKAPVEKVSSTGRGLKGIHKRAGRIGATVIFDSATKGVFTVVNYPFKK